MIIAAVRGGRALGSLTWLLPRFLGLAGASCLTLVPLFK